MALNLTFYGTLTEADEYFAQRLHEVAWTAATGTDRTRALIAARGLIDGLSFKGYKATVYTLLQTNPAATVDEIRIAEAAQLLEFPRGADVVVPEAIRVAAYEIAHSLLDGKDPEIELENLAVNAMSYGAVRTSYERTQLPVEHIINLCPSSIAWRLIRPFLRDPDALKLSRLS